MQNPNDTKDYTEEAEAEVRDVESDIKESMGSGKKHFLCNDYPAAISCFQEACSLLSEKYGQMAQECSDAYYYYGVSLLELARMENGVLGNALKGVPDEDDSDKDVEQFEKPNLEEKERQELRESVVAAMATEDEEEESDEDKNDEKGTSEDQKPEETVKDTEEMEGDDSKVVEKTSQDDGSEKNEMKKTEESTGSNDPQPGSEQPCSSKVESKDSQAAEDEPDDPEDIPNMQLAWEMLELAKVLYLKREKSENNSSMVAQCHLKLGELGLEVENYSQAIGDFLECLVLQKEILCNTDRKLAESHYNLGLAYTFVKQYDNAIEHYKTSLEVLENRVKYLEEVIDDKGNDDKDESMTECKEVGEIKELIPDIYSKIEDVIVLRGEKPSIRNFSPNVESGETTIGFGSGAQSSSSSCSIIPVKKSSSSAPKESTCDITHLVRRKRASPDDLTHEDGSGDNKKVKQEPSAKTTDASSDHEMDMIQESSSSEKLGDGNETKSASEPKEEVSICAKSGNVDAPDEGVVAQ